MGILIGYVLDHYRGSIVLAIQYIFDVEGELLLSASLLDRIFIPNFLILDPAAVCLLIITAAHSNHSKIVYWTARSLLMELILILLQKHEWLYLIANQLELTRLSGLLL